MKLPFTPDEFFDVFVRYNQAVWPMQWLLFLAAAVAVGLLWGGGIWKDRAIGGTLAVLWVWMGVAYHLAAFARINPAAWGFGAAFVAQGILFAWFARAPRLRFGWRWKWRGMTGSVLLGYALVLYPLLGWLAGHRYPASPTFGVPCPTTIFTVGLLCFAVPPIPRRLLVVPILWSAIGALAAVRLGVPQDFGLLAAALVGIGLGVASHGPLTHLPLAPHAR